MNVNWEMVAGMVAASLLTAVFIWLVTRSFRSYADDAVKPVHERIAAIEKDLLTNYVQHKHLDEMKKLMERLNQNFVKLQIMIASKLKLRIEPEPDES